MLATRRLQAWEFPISLNMATSRISQYSAREHIDLPISGVASEWNGPFTELKESAKAISACVKSAADYANKKYYYRNQHGCFANFY